MADLKVGVMTSETRKAVYFGTGLAGIFFAAVAIVWALGLFGIHSPPVQ